LKSSVTSVVSTRSVGCGPVVPPLEVLPLAPPLEFAKPEVDVPAIVPPEVLFEPPGAGSLPPHAYASAITTSPMGTMAARRM
jgi:hypothetical protein